VATAVPEARVVGLAQTPRGEIAASAARHLARLASENDAVVIGPGMSITPHAGEMARLRGISKAQIERDPQGETLRAAAAYRAVVVLKGDETWIAGPDGACYRNRTGNVGLATSGADPIPAAGGGVFVHGRAGDLLARRVARLGFLARELLAEVPVLLRDQEGRRR
jgi:NAD(P)H-hydrate repair Nnr-like enzyme with NAD(P)H-hydrate dehydratase domain